jgi:branched-chain amino acid transport system permease protein
VRGRGNQGSPSGPPPGARSLRVIEAVWPLLAPCLLVLAVVGLTALGSDILQRQAIAMLINLVLVVGLYTFAGNSGVLSFGHMSFMAVAAYVTALLTVPPVMKDVLLPHLPVLIRHSSLGPVEAALIAGLAAAVFAAPLSVALMRLSGLTASVAMFAVLLIVYEVDRNWVDVTRGTLTMLGVPTTVSLTSATAVAIAVIAGAYAFQRTRVGLRLRATREDEAAARAIGINIAALRRIAFVFSAFIVGIGGFEYAQFYGSFTADAFYLNITFITIAMLVIGGTMSLMGAVSCVVVLSALLEGLREIQDGVAIGPLVLTSPAGLREVGAAVAMLVILLVRPAGLVGGGEVTWRAAVTAARALPGFRRQPAGTPRL